MDWKKREMDTERQTTEAPKPKQIQSEHEKYQIG